MKFPRAGLAVIIAASAAITGCQQAPKELKIAIVAPLSGNLSGWGSLVRNGVVLAIDEWNARGGVLGKRIAAVMGDSQGDPNQVVKAADKVMTADKAHYIVGDVFSSLSIPLSEAANAAKVILMTPTSTNAAVTVDPSGSTKAYVFRTCFSDSFQGRAGASFAVKNLKTRKAYVMFDPDDVYVRGLAEAFADAFAGLGGAVVGKGSYSNTDTDFSKALAEAKAADIVYLPGASIALINLVTKKAKENGVRAVFLGGDFWDSPALDLRATDGSYFTNHYWPGDLRPEVQSFEKSYDRKYASSGEPDVVAGLSYDAANILLQAIQTAGKDDVASVKASLEGISFMGVSGTIIFDAQHNAAKSATVVHVTDGKVVFDSLVSP
jgi:branched-chain amino acid transport system substrate-binding protein